MQCKVHSPLRLLETAARSSYALIVLNQPLDFKLLGNFQITWSNSTWQLCADGGANRLYDVLSDRPELQRQLVPQLIVGDLDSVRPDVLKFYQNLGTRVIRANSQNATDLDKCLVSICELEKNLESQIPAKHADVCSDVLDADPEMGVTFQALSGTLTDIFIIGGASGRFDQTMGVLHSLHRLSTLQPSRNIWVLDYPNLITVLSPGTHRIDIDRKYNRSACGLLPIGGPVIASSTGLTWDLDRTELRFGDGGLVSACNRLALIEDADLPIAWKHRTTILDDISTCTENLQVHNDMAPRNVLTNIKGHVFVECSAPLVFSMSLRCK